MKDEPNVLSQIPGGRALVDWFGGVPTFHDGEVLSVHLERDQPSKLVVYGFRMNSETDAQGFYVVDRKVTATFVIDGIDSLELKGFSIQNVLNRLSIHARSGGTGYEIELEDTYGIGGRIGCEAVSVSYSAIADAS
jgi:hypothetical protein